MPSRYSSLLPGRCALQPLVFGFSLCVVSLARASAEVAEQGAGAAAEITKFSVINAGTLVQLLVSLAIIVGLIFGLAWYARKIQQFQLGKSGRSLRVLASTAVGIKERVVLIQVGDEQLLIGVAPGRVNLLSKLETPIEAAKDPAPTSSFVGHLRKAMASDDRQ